MFIIRSGTGYFTGFTHAPNTFTPCLTSDPLDAKRIGRDGAEWVVTKMEEAGFVAELVELVRASINGYCYVAFGSSMQKFLTLQGQEETVGEKAEYQCSCGCVMVVYFAKMEPLADVECQECGGRASRVGAQDEAVG